MLLFTIRTEETKNNPIFLGCIYVHLSAGVLKYMDYLGYMHMRGLSIDKTLEGSIPLLVVVHLQLNILPGYNYFGLLKP